MHHYALPFVFLLVSCANNTKTEPTPIKVEETKLLDTASVATASGKTEETFDDVDKNIELPCGELCDARPNTQEIITQQVDIRREQRVIREDLRDIKEKIKTLKAARAKKKEEKRKRKRQDESASN